MQSENRKPQVSARVFSFGGRGRKGFHATRIAGPGYGTVTPAGRADLFQETFRFSGGRWSKFCEEDSMMRSLVSTGCCKRCRSQAVDRGWVGDGRVDRRRYCRLSGTEQTGDRMRVLIVEDELKLAAYVKRGLEREGYAVDIANDGERGLWLGSNEPYDVIVLDILLPKMNGFVVCGELRKRSVWTPILMLTAKTGEHDEAEALDTGADDFLSKPFSFVCAPGASARSYPAGHGGASCGTRGR